jgi:hypothetical protein
MNELSRLRAEIAKELATEPVLEEVAPSEEFDLLLAEVARDRLPSETVILAMMADALPVDLPVGFEARARSRRHKLIAELHNTAPRLGPLLSQARRAHGETPRALAHSLGIAPRVWEAIEADESPAAVLNLPAGRVARLIDTLGLKRSEFALSLRAALASAAPTGFGYRPRQAKEEVGPASLEPADQIDRIWEWFLAYSNEGGSASA